MQINPMLFAQSSRLQKPLMQFFIFWLNLPPCVSFRHCNSLCKYPHTISFHKIYLSNLGKQDDLKVNLRNIIYSEFSACTSSPWKQWRSRKDKRTLSNQIITVNLCGVFISCQAPSKWTVNITSQKINEAVW